MTAFLRSWLTWSQALTSLYGFLGTVIAATYLDASDFGAFALMSLLQSIAIGFLRSALLQPALIHQRNDATYRPTLGALAVACIPLTITVLGASYAIKPDLTPTDITTLSVCIVGTFVHDWLRYRAIADDRLLRLVISDALRLILVIGAAVAAVPHFDAATSLAALLGTSWIACLVLTPTRTSLRGLNWRPVRTIAVWQSFELAIAQLQTTVPMWVVGVIAAASDLSAFRLAQTWLGPINLLTMALSTNLLADAARHPEMDVTVRAKTLARSVTLAAAALTLCAVGTAAMAAPHLAAVTPAPLLIAVSCVGAATVGTGYSGLILMALRITRQQRRVTLVRAWATLTIWATYACVYAMVGPFGSLVAGFLATAISFPFLTVLAVRLPAERRERLGSGTSRHPEHRH